MDKGYIDRKFDEIVEFSGVEKFVDTPVKRYSSGMYLRLAFAVAAHLEPEILVVDEVLAVGDAEFQKKCLGKMNEVAKQGRTVLFVSHNMAAVQSLCSRAVRLSGGSLASQGLASEVIAEYLDVPSAREQVDLRTTQRTGKGRVRIESLVFENESGARVSEGLSGQPLVIAMTYRSADNKRLRAWRASVAFYDSSGQVLFNCSSELTSAAVPVLPPTGTIRCLLPRLPLSKGRYLLSPFLEVNGDVEDWLRQAVALDVTDGDFYGTGRLYPAGWEGKGVLVDHRWLPGEAAVVAES
jgi:lipopolysaccharide transport system ATP-binding protein